MEETGGLSFATAQVKHGECSGERSALAGDTVRLWDARQVSWAQSPLGCAHSGGEAGVSVGGPGVWVAGAPLQDLPPGEGLGSPLPRGARARLGAGGRRAVGGAGPCSLCSWKANGRQVGGGPGPGGRSAAAKGRQGRAVSAETLGPLLPGPGGTAAATSASTSVGFVVQDVRTQGPAEVGKGRRRATTRRGWPGLARADESSKQSCGLSDRYALFGSFH